MVSSVFKFLCVISRTMILTGLDCTTPMRCRRDLSNGQRYPMFEQPGLLFVISFQKGRFVRSLQYYFYVYFFNAIYNLRMLNHLTTKGS